MCLLFNDEKTRMFLAFECKFSDENYKDLISHASDCMKEFTNRNLREVSKGSNKRQF